MKIREVEGSDFFEPGAEALAQLVVVRLGDATPGAAVSVVVEDPATGRRAEGSGAVSDSGEARLAIPAEQPESARGARDLVVTAVSAGSRAVGIFSVRFGLTGWTLHLVPHFHYDPVWWNTQAAFVSEWETMPGSMAARGMDTQLNAFELMRRYLDKAAAEPGFKFVISEVDYLKPWWSAFPERRAELLDLIRIGRVEVLGGSFNEPQTNLVSPETTIRSALVGMRYQKDLLGGDPSTAWQLDVFGHDPQYPGLMSQAGLTRSAWARGPFHEWGPMLPTGGNANFVDPRGMQFGSEFIWMSPSGRSLVTSYMTAHYFAGWWMNDAPTLGDAQWQVYDLFRRLQSAAATSAVMVPVGMDHAQPNRWVTAVQEDWTSRFVWPKVTISTPSEYFADVERDASRLTTQTRDMNPIFSGTHVSYIDTKQAHRAAENVLGGAEVLAALASRRGAASYPHAALDLAWRQLVFGAHHDAITGSESDQVYIDLLGSWREAWTIGRDVQQAALAALTAGEVDGVSVFNTSGHARGGLVTVDLPAGSIPLDEHGAPLPAVAESAPSDVRRMRFRVEDVPAVGSRSYRLATGEAAEWEPMEGTTLANAFRRIEVDPARGGAIVSIIDLDEGREIVTPGGLANEILVYDEYPNQPMNNELGPWYVSPRGGPAHRSGETSATAAAESSRLGQRMVVTGQVGSLRYRQTITLWHESDQVECATDLVDFRGADQLVRVAWACDVAGGLPMAETGTAVVGRAFAHPNEDAATHPRQYDAACFQWFGLGATARLRMGDGDGAVERAIGVAEIVSGSLAESTSLGTALARALVRRGVTSCNTLADGNRYGDPRYDSNSPDVRFAIGSPEGSAFVRAVLDAADPRVVEEFERQRAAHAGSALVYAPASAPLRETWLPGVSVTGVRDLPVVIATDAAAIERLCAGLREGVVRIPATGAEHASESVESYTVALMNRGVPSSAVDTSGTLYLSVLRSCTGWPSGVWLNPPVRTAPDGSAFQLQHWTHSFEYAFVAGAGDWRTVGLPRRAHDYNRPLAAAPGRSAFEDGVLVGIDADESIVISSVRELPGGELELRAAETHGAVSEATLRLAGPHRVEETNLLGEQPRSIEASDASHHSIRVGGYDTVTLRIDDAAAHVRAEDRTEVNPAGDQWARYWVGGTGAAPVGDLPVSVLVAGAARRDDGALAATVLVSREHRTGPGSGELRVRVHGDARLRGPERRHFELGADDHAAIPIELDGVGEGNTLLEVAAVFDGRGDSVVDARVLRVGDASETPVDEIAEGIDIRWDAGSGVSVIAGTRLTVTAVLTNRHTFPLRGRVQLLSPWGSWEWLRDWTRDVVAPAGDAVEVRFDVVVPLETPAGTTWMLPKLVGPLGAAYGPSLELRIDGR